VTVGYYGCTELTWSTVYTAQSPDSGARIEVQEFLRIGPDSSVRVRLRHGLRSSTIWRRSDCWFSFAHAAWKGPVAGVFVDGKICGQIRIAYSLEDRKVIPFEQVAEAVRKSIIREYAVTAEELAEAHGDPLVWATFDQFADNRAALEFRKRYVAPH
jgi:hypothetical protein